MDNGRAALACSCCGHVEVHPEMERRLAQLARELGGGLPSVVGGYRCADFCARHPELSHHLHGTGRAVSFETSNQEFRRRFLAVALRVFEHVYIYPNRVTVLIDDHPRPYCLVVS